MSDQCPRQAEGLEVNKVEDGYIVYHPARDRIHYLNHTAALVLELCTGANDADEIARKLGILYDLPHPPSQEVGRCLHHFVEEKLVC